jgi:hypothetical protein
MLKNEMQVFVMARVKETDDSHDPRSGSSVSKGIRARACFVLVKRRRGFATRRIH